MQRIDCDEDEETSFKRQMNKLMADPAGRFRKSGPKIKLDWGYLGAEGEVKGCELCRGELFISLIPDRKLTVRSIREERC